MFRASYEVEVRRDGRWVLEAAVPGEAAAAALADGLAAGDTSVTAVRVVRLKTGITGREYASVVSEREIDRPPPPTNVARGVDRADRCDTAADLYRIEARLAAGRAMRAWLDRQGLTPMELLHSGRDLKRAMDADQLVPGAVFRVAKIQAEAAGDDAAVRRRHLDGLIREAADRAREADARRRLPILEQTTLAALIAGFPDLPADQAADPTADAVFWPRVVLARDLTGRRSLTGKLERLLDLATGALAETAAAGRREAGRIAVLVDPFLADCLAAAEPVQDLLGPQPDLAGALVLLLDLIEGRCAAPPTATAERVTALAAAADLPDVRATLLDRVRRSLAGETPLARDSRAADRALGSLTGRLVRPGGMVGGPAIAAALVDRAQRGLASGGAGGRVRAIQAAAGCCPTPWQEIVFLIALAHEAAALPAGSAALATETVGGLIGETLSRARTADDLWRALPPADRQGLGLDVLAAALAGAPLEESAKKLATAQLQRLSAAAAVA